jgi:hypothetical protein
VSNDNDNIIKRTCAGGCGEVLHYLLVRTSELHTPDLTCLDGVTAYRGGHLCLDCDVAVEEVLARRRERRQRMASASAPAKRRPQADVRARKRR